MDNERFTWFQWKLARFYFLCLGIYTLFIIIANWLAVLNILDPHNAIYRLATYGGSISAFIFLDRCEKTYNNVGFELGYPLGISLFLIYVFTFAGVALGVEELFEYTVYYLS